MWLNKGKVLPFLFLFFYWLMFNYLVLHNPPSIFPDPQVDAIKNVQFIVSDAEKPESLNASNWQAQTLPDDWYQSQKGKQQVWYRANVVLEQPTEEVWAVYLPAVSHNAAVYINDTWIGQGGSFDDPVSRHHNKPLLFSFSSNLVRQGNNEVLIRVKTSYHEQGYLDQFFIAPMAQLKSEYLWKHIVRVEFIQWITMSMYLMAGIVFVFWLARPQDGIYGLFSLELFFWASHNLNLFVSDIPMSARSWEAMTMATLGWTIVTMVFFNHRYVGYGSARMEKIVLVFAIFGVAIFLLPDIASVLHIGYRIWDVFLVVFGSYAIIHLLKAYWQKQNTDVYLMLLAGIPILVFGFHDILLVNHFIDRTDGLIIQYSVIPAALLFSWFLVKRFVQSINRAEYLAATLEQRVQQKQQELHEQYEKYNALEKQQVLAEERERIMRDMHDGVGGQLVSVVTMLQEHSGDVFNRLREKVEHSLTDLRFVIDSLDPLMDDLPTMLGMMRMRLVDELELANIELEWAVTELPKVKEMGPRRSLHIMRIVQEAITNIIKHSDSNKMTLATGVNDQGDFIYIDIIDYGKGISSSSKTESSSRGLKNMQYRAQQIDSKLEIDTLHEGTRVRLLLAC